MQPLNDGETFAILSEDGKSIDVFSYKTGKKIKEIFSIDALKGDLKIENFDSFQISGNEKKILLWNNSQKIYRNSFYADYYVYDVLRSTLKAVSENGSQRGAVLSNDGRMVAFVRDNNIYISFLEYGTEHQVTEDGKLNKIINGSPDWAYEEEFGVQNTIRWSADDSQLAYIRFDETDVPVYGFDEYGIYSPENELGSLYPDRFSYKYPLAGYPNSDVAAFVYDVLNKSTKKMELELNGKYIPSMEFDGKGENLMIMTLDRNQNHLEIYRVNPKSTVAQLLIVEESQAWLSPDAYRMVRYYQDSFVIGSSRDNYRHLYEYDYNGNLRRRLTSGKWNVTDYYGKDKNGRHYLQTTQKGAINRNLACVEPGGSIKLLNDVEGTESASFSTNFDYYVRKYSNALTPPQYSICDNRGKQISVIEDNKDYAMKFAGAPRKEFLTIPNDENQEMNAYIIKPSGFSENKKYPLVMYQYNGPDSQLVLNEWKMDGTYYIASEGYLVCAVDGRGTGNRSRDWAQCVYKQLGKFETIDQLAAARYFTTLPFVDPEKTACFGWSYGGYMTLMELASSDCVFKAGIAMAPVSDWRFYDSIYTERYMSTPQQNKDGYDMASALLKSANVKAKLLIMSGTSDDNVHFYNTLRYTSKLNYEGKMFDMMAYSGFEHSLRMGNARTQLYRKIVEFLNLNVKN